MLIPFFTSLPIYREREEELLLRLTELPLLDALLRLLETLLPAELLLFDELPFDEPIRVTLDALEFLLALLALRTALLLLLLLTLLLRVILLPALLLLLRDEPLLDTLELLVLLLLLLLRDTSLRLLLEPLLLPLLLRTELEVLALRVEFFTSEEELRLAELPLRVGVSEITAVRRFSSELTLTLRLLLSREGIFTKPSLRS